jgi:hypothetical protein
MSVSCSRTVKMGLMGVLASAANGVHEPRFLAEHVVDQDAHRLD